MRQWHMERIIVKMLFSALPPQIIDRIFSGAVTRSQSGKRVREAFEIIGYTDFVAFLLAEEDKRHPTR